MTTQSSSKVLRVAIVFEWLLIGCALFATFRAELPTSLESFTAENHEWKSVFDIVSLFALAGSISSSIGLWFFRTWARPTYLVTTIWCAVSVVFNGPSIHPASVATLNELSLIVAGFVVGISYFGNTKVDDQTRP